MFSLKKKSLTRVICAALTFMSALPFGVARAGNTVTVTDSGPDNPGAVIIDNSKGVAAGNEDNTLTVNVESSYNNLEWYAAYSAGAVIFNNLYFLNGTAEDIYGGYSENGDINNNVVKISGGKTGWVYGGYGYGCDRDSRALKVDYNKVEISGGITGNVYGGYNASIKGGTAAYNELTVTGGQADNVYGGYGENGAVAGDNRVIMSGGVAKKLVGGYSPVSKNNEVYVPN